MLSIKIALKVNNNNGCDSHEIQPDFMRSIHTYYQNLNLRFGERFIEIEKHVCERHQSCVTFL